MHDGAFLLAAESVSRLVAFSLSFVVARTLGLEELATLTLALSLIGFATVAGDSGLGNVAVADISQGEHPVTSVRRTAPVQVWLSIAATAGVGAYLAITMTSQMAIAVAGLPVVVAAAAGYVLQAQLKHRQLAVARTLGNLCTGVLGTAVALSGQSLPAVAFVYVLGAIVTTTWVNRKAGVRAIDFLRFPDVRHLRRTWKLSIAVALYMLTVHTYATAQLWLAERLEGSVHFVDTAIAMRLLVLAVIPSVMLGSLLLPRYAAEQPTNRQRGVHVALAGAGGLVIALVGVVLAPLYVPVLFGEGAEQAVRSVQVVMLHLPASFAATVLTTYLLSRKRYHIAVAVYLFALVIQIFWCSSYSDAGTPKFVAGIVVSEWIFLFALMVACLRRPGERVEAGG